MNAQLPCVDAMPREENDPHANVEKRRLNKMPQITLTAQFVPRGRRVRDGNASQNAACPCPLCMYSADRLQGPRVCKVISDARSIFGRSQSQSAIRCYIPDVRSAPHEVNYTLTKPWALQAGCKVSPSEGTKQWKKEQVWPFLGCCTADSQTETGRHQLYNNGSLVLFSTAWMEQVFSSSQTCAISEVTAHDLRPPISNCALVRLHVPSSSPPSRESICERGKKG